MEVTSEMCSDDTERDEPVALAYDDAANGELIAKLYTLEVAAECEDSWWIRVEYTDERYVDTDSDRPGGDDE